jgi:hypothetical protein
MNFKNISLFSLLFVFGFVGTVVRGEFEVKMNLEEKMAYKEQEFVVCYKELLGVKGAYQKCQYLRMLAQLSCQSYEDSFAEGSIEACMYAEHITVNRDRLAEQYNSLKEELQGLQNEIYEIKDELGIPHDVAKDSEYREYSNKIDEVSTMHYLR